jgi:hypothetical protein
MGFTRVPDPDADPEIKRINQRWSKYFLGEPKSIPGEQEDTEQ